MRVAIYARVSTVDQQALIQIEELQRHCRARDWDVYRVYSDAITGAAVSRPGRDQLMIDAKARRFDAVLVTKLDRWARSLVDLMESVNVLRKLGVRWIAVDQNIDTDRHSPLGNLMLQLMGAFAEFERALIRERVNSGMAHAKAHGTRSGKRIGREPKVFDRVKAYADRMAGASWAELAERYGAGATTIRDGIARYAHANNLPMPEPAEVAEKRPRSPKSGGGAWVCKYCTTPYATRDQMRACCPDDRKAAKDANRDPATMQQRARLAVQKRIAKTMNPPSL